MRSSLVISALVGLPAALAFPSLSRRQDDDFSSFTPAGDDDDRSPCPMLNTLANHGKLPHNGRGIDQAALTAAFASINVASDIALGLFKGAIKKGLIDPDSQILNLNALRAHNAIEHDGSLSRANYDVAPNNDNYSFNQTVFDEYLSFLGDDDTLDLKTMAKARFARVNAERKREPDMTYGLFQSFASNGETSLLMGALGDVSKQEIELDHLKVFFQEERLPVKEGWAPAKHQLNIPNLSALLLKELVASGEPIQGILDFLPGHSKSITRREAEGHLALLFA